MGVLLPPAAADNVAYRWVDQEGVTHFSDTPPPADNTSRPGVESIALADFPAVADPAADYYSIVNQWKRLREELADQQKLVLEQRRLNLQRLRAEQAATPPPARSTAPVSAPLVLWGGYTHAAAYGYYGGQRQYRSMQPYYYPQTPRDVYSRTPPAAHFQPGNSGTDQAPSSTARVTFRCCREAD